MSKSLLEDLQDAIDTAETDAGQVRADAEGPYSLDAALAYIEGLNAARALAERHTSGPQREVTIRPAYDCIEVQPCALGGERCAAGVEGASHGRGEALMHFVLRDQLREVHLRVGTGWSHPATPADIVGRLDDVAGPAPRFPELEFHSAEWFSGAWNPLTRPPCPRGWRDCYSATFLDSPKEVPPLLATGGTDAVWAWLEDQWSHQFGAAAADA
jgi:hypothetical protein